MGGVTSAMASKFAFFPPIPPTYGVVVEDEEAGLLSMTGVTRRSNVEVRRLRTKKGNDIIAMYVRNRSASLTILYSHGNAADLGQLYDLLSELSIHLHVNVMGYDYSGYGQSSGKPSEQNTYHDIEAVYRCLKDNYETHAERIVLYGQSVGSGPTLDLATQLSNLRAVVLHSPILSGLRVMYPVKHSFWFDIYKNIDKVPRVTCTVLIIHGTADEVVDWSHGKRLWELCKEKYEPLWIKGGHHCNLELYPEYIRHLKKFISVVEKNITATAAVETGPATKPDSTDPPKVMNSDLAENKKRSSANHPPKISADESRTDSIDPPRLSSDLAERNKCSSTDGGDKSRPDSIDPPRLSTDLREHNKSSTDHGDNKSRPDADGNKEKPGTGGGREKPRVSTDRRERLARVFDRPDRGRNSVDQTERPRNSIDRFSGRVKSAVLCNMGCFKHTTSSRMCE